MQDKPNISAGISNKILHAALIEILPSWSNLPLLILRDPCGWLNLMEFTFYCVTSSLTVCKTHYQSLSHVLPEYFFKQHWEQMPGFWWRVCRVPCGGGSHGLDGAGDNQPCASCRRCPHWGRNLGSAHGGYFGRWQLLPMLQTNPCRGTGKKGLINCWIAITGRWRGTPKCGGHQCHSLKLWGLGSHQGTLVSPAKIMGCPSPPGLTHTYCTGGSMPGNSMSSSASQG